MWNCMKSIGLGCTMVIVLCVSHAQSQVTCPVGENGWINVTQIPDTKTGVIFNGKLFGASNVDEVQTGSSILVASFDEDGNDTVILLSTRQPNFTNILDFDGISSLVLEGDSGLIIYLNNQTMFICSVYITIEDTNNQPPNFNKEVVNFRIPSDWNKQVPLNWYFNNEILITDRDFNLSNAQVSIINSNGVSGSLQLIVNDEQTSVYAYNTYNVHLHVQDVVAGNHTIIASDGVNFASIEVLIEIEEKNLHPPAFQNTGYYETFESIPKIGDVVPISISAVDPDYMFGTDMSYSVSSDFLNYSNGDLVFTKTDDLIGQVKTVAVTATENIPDGKSTDVNLTLKFEYSNEPKFTMPFYEVNLFQYPSEGHVIANLTSQTNVYPETVSYQLGNSEHQFIGIVDGEILQFTQNVTEDTDLGTHDYIVFEVLATVQTDPTRNSSATFVITFSTCKSNTCNCGETDCKLSKTGLIIGLVCTSVLAAVTIVIAGYLVWVMRNSSKGFTRKFLHSTIRRESTDNLRKPSSAY